MSNTFFKDKNLGDTSNASINSKNQSNRILNRTEKPKGKFDVGSQANTNPSEQNGSILSRRPR